MRGDCWADKAAVEFLAAAARLLPAADPDALYRYAVDRVVAARSEPRAERPQLCRSSSSATPKGERRRALPSLKGVFTGM